MKKLILFTAVIMISFSLQAQSPNHTCKKAKLRQNVKIKHGIHHGDITPREAARIRAKRKDLKRTKRRAQADGNVGPRERRRIVKKNKGVNKTIRRAKHN